MIVDDPALLLRATWSGPVRSRCCGFPWRRWAGVSTIVVPSTSSSGPGPTSSCATRHTCHGRAAPRNGRHWLHRRRSVVHLTARSWSLPTPRRARSTSASGAGRSTRVLRGIEHVTSAASVGRLLDIDPDDANPLAVEVVAYRPTQRTVIKVSSVHGDVVHAYVKVAAPDAVRSIAQRHASLRSANVPAPLVTATDEALGLLVLEPLVGPTLRNLVKGTPGAWPSPDEFDRISDGFAATSTRRPSGGVEAERRRPPRSNARPGHPRAPSRPRGARRTLRGRARSRRTTRRSTVISTTRSSSSSMVRSRCPRCRRCRARRSDRRPCKPDRAVAARRCRRSNAVAIIDYADSLREGRCHGSIPTSSTSTSPRAWSVSQTGRFRTPVGGLERHGGIARRPGRTAGDERTLSVTSSRLQNHLRIMNSETRPHQSTPDKESS